jgi:hypothetical protein
MRVENFRADRKGSKLATFDLLLPSGIILKGWALMGADGRKWIGPGAWFCIVDFVDRSAKDRFVAAVLAAAMQEYGDD